MLPSCRRHPVHKAFSETSAMRGNFWSHTKIGMPLRCSGQARLQGFWTSCERDSNCMEANTKWSQTVSMCLPIKGYMGTRNQIIKDIYDSFPFGFQETYEVTKYHKNQERGGWLEMPTAQHQRGALERGMELLLICLLIKGEGELARERRWKGISLQGLKKIKKQMYWTRSQKENNKLWCNLSLSLLSFTYLTLEGHNKKRKKSRHLFQGLVS